MPNPIIKFSHSYKKLRLADGTMLKQAKLLDVRHVNLGSLSKDFLAYDTDNGLYKLPESDKYLMLIFLKQPGKQDPVASISFDLFTTLRRSTPSELVYYNKLIGEVFDIELTKAKTES